MHHDREASRVFDRAQALDGVDHDVELLEELVTLFLEDFGPMMDRLGAAVAAGDATEVEHMAHAIKGAVGVLAAAEVADHALALERDGRNGDLSQAPGRFAELDAAAKRLRSALRGFVPA
jgi:HPt (histidine-containing phosphotransfer) domain-containing protein